MSLLSPKVQVELETSDISINGQSRGGFTENFDGDEIEKWAEKIRGVDESDLEGKSEELICRYVCIKGVQSYNAGHTKIFRTIKEIRIVKSNGGTVSYSGDDLCL